jgi:futalosine hydrolase
MSFEILVVAATTAEANVLKKISGLTPDRDGYTSGNLRINILTTGVGSIATSWAMTRWLASNEKPDLALNIGIAGSFNFNIKTGEVVVPVSECFADAGIETVSGFLTLGEAGLEEPDKDPYKSGKILVENRFITMALDSFKAVNAITVNTATGSLQTINKLIKKFNPDIETMEGATFFYICSKEKIPFLALRSISNMVEPRNRNNWNIELALENLSEGLQKFLLMINE